MLVDSIEFAEWMAYWELSAELMDPNREPTPDEVGDKLAAAFALHNAKLEAKEARKVKR